LARCLCALARFHDFARIDRIEATLNGAARRRLKPTLTAGTADFCYNSRQAGAFSPKVVSGKMLFDDVLDITGHHDQPHGSAAFAGNKSACPATFFCKPSDPTPDSGPADAQLPDCITYTALQAPGAAEICLNKRSKDRCPTQRLSTGIATVFVSTFHRCQPSNPAHAVSALMARMSDLKARYHI
jgi:hypothetical protein